MLTVSELLGRPLNLRERLFAPRTLYVAGRGPVPIPAPRVSVVGTRNPSEEGIELARKLVEKLTREGVVVISGLARGIDTVAHTTALENGGMTVAVLGTPLDRFYPPENRELQKRLMREQLVISQFPSGSPIRKENFVLRNRTIALISDAMVVVEASEGGGSASAARAAIRLGRQLFLTPLCNLRVEGARILNPTKII